MTLTQKHKVSSMLLEKMVLTDLFNAGLPQNFNLRGKKQYLERKIKQKHNKENNIQIYTCMYNIFLYIHTYIYILYIYVYIFVLMAYQSSSP